MKKAELISNLSKAFSHRRRPANDQLIPADSPISEMEAGLYRRIEHWEDLHDNPPPPHLSTMHFLTTEAKCYFLPGFILVAYNEARKEKFCQLTTEIINFLEPEPTDLGSLRKNINSLWEKISSKKLADKKTIKATNKLLQALDQEA